MLNNKESRISCRALSSRLYTIREACAAGCVCYNSRQRNVVLYIVRTRATPSYPLRNTPAVTRYFCPAATSSCSYMTPHVEGVGAGRGVMHCTHVAAVQQWVQTVASLRVLVFFRMHTGMIGASKGVYHPPPDTPSPALQSLHL